MKKIIKLLPKRFKWTIHNMIAHPLMEICYLLGSETLSEKIHSSTLPEEDVLNDIINPERDD